METRSGCSVLWRLLLLQQLLLSVIHPVWTKITDDEIVVVSETQAVAGGVAKLPCDISAPTPGDRVHLVIWYKENADSPIYSFDSRGKNFGEAKHWADEQTLGGRAFFRFTDSPAKLTVESVKDADGGVYRCRVDFKKSPTRNTKVNLTVLIPPEKLVITDDRGSGNIPQYILGPYNEGSSVDITCIALGGRPSPRVTWWQENALLDDSYEQTASGRVENVLRLDKLGRRHLHTIYTCQATNNNLVAPVSSAVTLDMNLRPLWVRLQGENRPLSADNTYELTCEAVGARPPPVMSWMKGSIPMRNTRETTSPDTNTTTSTLTFVPTMEDSGKILTCRAGTPLIPDSSFEDGWKLNIHHVPIVTLELGSNLNATVIREGIDVYFECNIKSNPWVYKVSWRHNGKMLFNNASMGTIVTNQSLVLQNVNRGRAGLYTCVGSNQEGDGESNPVYLDVKYAPVCKQLQQKVYGVGRQEAARILCELDANPPDVHFLWRFNNTSETVDIQASHFTTDRARSTATYTPMTELDYGSLLCLGRNDQGVQQTPCVYHVIPAGKPDGLHNCSIVNQTAEALYVECTEGFDGGLTQEFIMEVYDAVTQNLVTNVTSRTPTFVATGLESGLGFDVSLYAANRKGKSDPTSLHAYTLKAPEKRTGRDPLIANKLKPAPPEDCTVIHHTINSLRVGCVAPSFYDAKDKSPTNNNHIDVENDNDGDGGGGASRSASATTTTYVLHVYDAASRRLLASSTSQTPGTLEVTDLDATPSGALLLSVRTVTAHAVSDAVSIYTTIPKSPLQQRAAGAATPTILHITPILGLLIGVVAALVLVAVIIVVVMRLRGRDDDDAKDRDDGGMGGGARRGVVAACGDKASVIPLKEVDDSVDSMDEKNPDIIPQNSETDYLDPDEKAFEKLNNAPNRIYANAAPRMPSPNRDMYENTNNVGSVPKKSDEVTYAELSLPKQQQPLLYSNSSHQQQPVSILRRQQQEPTVYAQIDVSKKLAPLPEGHHHLPPQQQPPLTFQHPASLPLLHHHHALAAAYQHPSHTLPHRPHRPLHPLEEDPLPSAETPLISAQHHRESTV